MSRSPLRYLLYSHDTYGLGHLRRALSIAEGIVTADPHAEVLIATGSPQAQAFTLPERVDSLKLPSVTKDAAGAYQPRRITADVTELVALRSGVLLAAYTHYQPDVVLVDQSPMGMGGELLPLLSAAEHGPRRPRLVLGLRDIIDDAERVAHEWDTGDVWQWVERYDHVVVYGDDTITTTATELALAERIGRPVTHVGYVAPNMPDPVGDEPFVLVTTGGGGDGQRLLRRYLAASEAGAVRGLKSIVVTGPLLSSGRRAELMLRADARADLDLVEFTPNLRQLVASAVGVVSMAGYNTVVEELAAGVPSMLVPRTEPRLEQDIRARRLAEVTSLEHCALTDFSCHRLHDFVDRARTRPLRPAGCQVGLDGAQRVASLLLDLPVKGASHV